jgi:hypothetical protein
VNELSCNAENATRQPHTPRYSPSRDNPLQGAVLANSQLKLYLRRLRADSSGSHRTSAISRLLDVNEFVDKSLAWLKRCAPDEPHMAPATDHELAELGQHLAMESEATPEAVEVGQ